MDMRNSLTIGLALTASLSLLAPNADSFGDPVSPDCGGDPVSSANQGTFVGMGNDPDEAFDSAFDSIKALFSCECAESGCNLNGPNITDPSGRLIDLYASPDGSNDINGDGYNDEYVVTRNVTATAYSAKIRLPLDSTISASCTPCYTGHGGNPQ